jgi:hypothetical protein
VLNIKFIFKLAELDMMTGPGVGKLLLEGARVFIVERDGVKEVEAEVYIHVRGYSLARVTHLDIESPELNEFYPTEGGKFLPIIGIKDGIEMRMRGVKIRVIHPLLNSVLDVGGYTRTWVGGKKGGIYIGFRREEIRKLEKLSKERFGFPV